MPRPRPAARLDPRAPYVLDTRELGRRPGSMRRVRVRLPAPTDVGTPMLHVPADAELSLDLRLESVMEGVLVSGTVTAPLAGECARCLEPVDYDIEVDLQQLFVYPGTRSSAGEDEDDEIGALVDDLIDIEPAVRDAIVLDLPLIPLCQDDCPGLCDRCGQPLADLPADHAHTEPDPRWAALAGLGDNGPTETNLEN